MSKAKGQVKIEYNAQKDAFELYSRGPRTNEWGLVVSCFCMRSEQQPESAEPRFVDYSILTNLRSYIVLGYELVNF